MFGPANCGGGKHSVVCDCSVDRAIDMLQILLGKPVQSIRVWVTGDEEVRTEGSDVLL